MPDYDPAITEHVGLCGRAERLPQPDIPEASETVSHWLLTAPPYHPLWSQYMLAGIRLRDDVPWRPEPPHRQFPGATHELLVVALNPDQGPYTGEKMLSYAHTGDLPYLLPVNHAHQFEATDEELEQLAWFAAFGVVHGVLNPETADAPERIRENWLAALVKTLAHIRGEEHSPT